MDQLEMTVARRFVLLLDLKVCTYIWWEATLILSVLFQLHKQPPPELKLH